MQASIKVAIPLTPQQHEWLMDLVKREIAADMSVYFEDGQFMAEIANPHGNVIHGIEPKIEPKVGSAH